MKLNQVIAVEKGVRADATRALTSAYHTLQKTGGDRSPLAGLAKTYRSKDEDGDRLPDESTRVQLTARGALDEVRVGLARMWDVVATKDETNTRARADVKIGETVIWSQLPTTTLLFIEKQLTDLATLISKLPVLDPAVDWTWNAAAGAYASDAVETTRTKKIPRNHVLAEATEKHPAQVQMYTEDVVVGYWRTTRYSGAVERDEMNAMMTRVRALQDAVKQAREKANMTDVTEIRGVGAAMLDYVLDGGSRSRKRSE